MPLRLPKVRSDLQFFEKTIEGKPMVLVRDPIRNSYFKYNPLQAAMLRSLDGVHSVDEMVGNLGREYDVEIPASAAERFVAHARKQLLLDVACYGVPDQQAHDAVMREFAKQGYRFRDLSIQQDANFDRRVVSAEAVLFMGGVRQLRAGQPAKALDYFSAVLELNPNNRRARFLADMIQRTYVKTFAARASDTRTLPLFNPTRLLRFIDRWFGRILFSWIGVLGLVALVVAAAYSYANSDHPSLQIGTFDIALAVVLTIVHLFLHELGHALACHHYGGEVNEIGFAVLYFLPTAYCDTSSTYLFTNRRHLVIVQLAGIYVTLALACVFFIASAVFHPSLFFYPALILLRWYTVFLAALNLIPLVKFDGYYALCDYLGIPNMRERSIKLLKATASRSMLGIAAPMEDLTPQRERTFLWFGMLSVLFTTFWLYLTVFRLFAPIVEQFRGIGFAIGLGVIFYMLRRVMFRPLWRLLLLLGRERRQVFKWKRSLIFALLLACAIVPWTIETAVRVDAEFVLAPKQRVDVRVQAAGFIERVLVREGQRVHKDDPLAVLRNDDLHLQLETLEAERDEIDAHLERLRNGPRREELERASRQLAVARAANARDQRRATVASQLAESGLGPKAAATSTSGSAQVSGSLASAAAWQLADLRAGARVEDVDATVAERARLSAQIERAQIEIQRLTVRSPIDGVVVTKRLDDHLYERLQPGDLIAEIHDTSAYVAEIHVAGSAPLGELSVGDRVVLESRGAPGTSVECTVARMRGATELNDRGDHSRRHIDASDDGDLVVTTTTFASTVGPSGITGHARLYGNVHTLAYSMLYLPLQRVFRVNLWSRL